MSTNNISVKRGVTLLLVLGLMTMFALLVVTFMVTTTQARRAAETAAKIIAFGGVDQASQETRAALQKLLTGDKLQSVIGPWSILEDMYGHPVAGTDWLESTFASAPTRTDGNSLWSFSPSPIDLSFANFSSDPAPLDLVGTVLTITATTSGKKELVNKSTRIFRITPAPTVLASTVSIVPFPDCQPVDLVGCSYVINGAAFSGTGPGFIAGTPGTAQLTGDDGDTTAANKKIYAERPNIFAPNSDGSTPYKVDLAESLMMLNTDYTAPDALHPFLAWLGGKNAISDVIPSFHRPGIASTGGSTTPTLSRKTILRPAPFDHPDFDGSNTNLAGANFTTNIKLAGTHWDVDNDGDGIPDSIWIDAGLGTYTDPKTSKTYKKLAAYLVVDMDGRLNLNVHGNTAQANAAFGSFGSELMKDVAGHIEVRGGGYGPAEVQLGTALASLFPSLFSATTFAQMMQGKINTTTGLPIAGRYGKEYLVTTAGSTASPGNPGLASTASTAAAWFSNKAGVNAWAYDHPDQFSTPFSPSSPALGSTAAGGLVPDWWGQAAHSFDPLGNRVVNLFTAPTVVYQGNPYLMNPYGKDGNDSPFSPEQLESVLRTQGDADFGSLPTGMRTLLGETTLSETSPYRLQVTTRSSDLPTPSRFLGVSASGADWSIYRKVFRAVGSNPTKAATLLNLLPIEIRQGLRVNLNRPSLSDHWVSGTGLYNHETGLHERAKFAQEIFYLLLVLNFDELFGATPYTEGTLDTQDKVITRLAQWSVNLVDFMDPDATMTPFIFSVDPFTGTSVYDNFTDMAAMLPVTGTGIAPNLSGNLRLIWGMEKPEVAITETLATHNRRVADSILESGTASTQYCTKHVDGNLSTCQIDVRRANPSTSASCYAEHDTDFDQVLRPQGSLFVELYRCGNPGRSHVSSEIAAAGAPTKLDLARTTPPVLPATIGDYIWRLAIGATASTTHTRNLNDDVKDLFINSTTRVFQPTQWNAIGSTTRIDDVGNNKINVERFVWFGNACSTLSTASNRSFWNPSSSNVALLEPNTYLVIGPRAATRFSNSVDGPSFGTPATTPEELTLSTLEDNEFVKTMIASMSAGGLELNISEPTPGSPYPTIPSGEAVDEPFDDLELFSRGTIPCYRSVFLQRLADPNRPYNAEINPYITVDWSMIDLHVFNSEKDKDSVVNEDKETNDTGTPITYASNYLFGARQWGVNGASSIAPNLWDRNTLFTTADSTTAGLTGSTTLALRSTNNSLGKLNKYVGVTSTDKSATYGARYEGVPDDLHPFIAFAWNDSPFANPLEVMQVPACSASRFGIEFHDTGTTNPTQSLGSSGRFRSEGTDTLGYLLNFEANGTGTLNLGKFLDQVTVPSRFNGTIVNRTTGTPPQPIYSYQEPGKINLNTVTEAAWAGLGGNSTDYSYLQSQIHQCQYPFRSAGSTDLVSSHSTTSTTATLSTTAGTSLRSTSSGGLLFKSREASVSNMVNEYENVARLSSMTTNRSNVFAVWVTVGYFEVKKYDKNSVVSKLHVDYPSLVGNITATNFDAMYPDGFVLGKEKGLDDGTLKRHRSFYLIDRTIPVGFRRGETLNSEDVILLQRNLE